MDKVFLLIMSINCGILGAVVLIFRYRLKTMTTKYQQAISLLKSNSSAFFELRKQGEKMYKEIAELKLDNLRAKHLLDELERKL